MLVVYYLVVDDARELFDNNIFPVLVFVEVLSCFFFFSLSVVLWRR